jgi:hypothetical protein
MPHESQHRLTKYHHLSLHTIPGSRRERCLGEEALRLFVRLAHRHDQHIALRADLSLTDLHRRLGHLWL